MPLRNAPRPGRCGWSARRPIPVPGRASRTSAATWIRPRRPRSYADLSGSCDAATASTGTHVFYAASRDNAGNVSAVASITFRIVAVPDLLGLTGPSGLTSSAPYTYTYHSSLTGATFQCRLDAAAFAVCGTAVSYPTLASGAHHFEVRAVSPDGVASQTQSRDFTIGTTTVTKGCSGLVPYGNDPSGPAGSDPCEGMQSAPCPAGSVCTLKTAVSVADQDVRTL